MGRLRDAVAGALGLLVAGCGGDGSTEPGGGSNIVLPTKSVSFGGLVGGPAPPPQTVVVRSALNEPLTSLAVGPVTYGGGVRWLSASLDRATTPATVTLTATSRSLSTGSYTATVPIVSSEATNRRSLSR